MTSTQPPWYAQSIQKFIERLGLPTFLVLLLMYFVYTTVIREQRASAKEHQDLAKTHAQYQADIRALALDIQVNNRIVNAQLAQMVRLAQLQCVYLAETNPQRAACMLTGEPSK